MDNELQIGLSDYRYMSDITFKKYIWLVICAFSVETIIRYIVILIGKIPVVSVASGMFTPALFIVLILWNNTTPFWGKIKAADCLLVIIYLCAVAFSYGFYPNNREYILEMFSDVFFAVPLYFFLGLSFRCEKRVIEKIVLLSKVIVCVDVLFVIYYTATGQLLNEDSMARAYRMLPSVLYLIYFAFERRKGTDKIWAIFSFTYLITCGTRGPVVVSFFYLVYCIFFKLGRSLMHRFFACISIAGIYWCYVAGVFNNVLLKVMGLVEELGLSTRVFDYAFRSALISDSSGREEIYARVWKLINESFWGYGILGEYQFLSWNTHNLYLQVFMHFGLFIGCILLVILFGIVLRALIKNPNRIAIDLIVLWGSITIVRGFFGGSYLTYYFAFFLGLCINEIRCKKYEYGVGD